MLTFRYKYVSVSVSKLSLQYKHTQTFEDSAQCVLCTLGYNEWRARGGNTPPFFSSIITGWIVDTGPTPISSCPSPISSFPSPQYQIEHYCIQAEFYVVVQNRLKLVFRAPRLNTLYTIQRLNSYIILIQFSK